MTLIVNGNGARWGPGESIKKVAEFGNPEIG
jgi:hypothetical protein